MLVAFCLFPARFGAAEPARNLDPAAWGSDHVGKPVPEFQTGDECLFCHRADVGPTWALNRHNRTLRAIDPQSPALEALRQALGLKERAAEVEFVLGGEHRQRFLKAGTEYGKLDLLSVEWAPPRAGQDGRLISPDRPHWDANRFGEGCAGCHTSGVDSSRRTFTTRSLECFVCHGEVPDEHSKDGSLVFLARKRVDAARLVTSVCAQCHVRTGNSKSTRLPYPNNFVAGDNLFRDFQVDLSARAIKHLNPVDAHILTNVRAVAVRGNDQVSCLSCHDVHKQSSKKHHLVPTGETCVHCHEPNQSKKVRKVYEVHSDVCGY